MTCIREGLALIFDLDGVVIDSMPLHLAAWQRYLAGIGIELREDGSRMQGRRNDDIVAEFIGGELSPQQVWQHGAAKEALFREMMQPHLVRYLVPGIAEFLDRCNGARIGLATNAEPANVDFVLEGARLQRYFQVVVDGHQVARPKPYPDIYLRAAGLLGVAPRNCIVFEDSPTGIEAGRASGARVVAVGCPPGERPQVSLCIQDFFDPALEPWLRTVEVQD